MAFRKYVAKIVRNGNSLTVGIPSSLCGEFGLRRGDHVYVVRVGHSLLVTPVEDFLTEISNRDQGAAMVAITEMAKL